MRVDFEGTFKQVARLIDARSQSAPSAPESNDFAATLASLTEQSPENNAKSTPKGVVAVPPKSDMMASLHFDPPASKSPPLEPFNGQLTEPEKVKDSSGSVKTPAVLAVRRITADASATSAQPSDKVQHLQNLVAEAGRELGIDPALGLAVAATESSFDPKAISTDGHASKGLFQLLDQTGKELHEQTGLETKYDPFNPDQNALLGIQYLRRLHETFSHDTKLPNELASVTAANSASLEKLAVAAFNAGEGRVASAQAHAKAAGHDPGDYDQVAAYLPKSTQEYVTRVMQLKTQFGGGDIG